MDLFNLAAKLTLDDSEFKRGTSAAEKTGKSLGESLQNTFGKIKKFATLAVSGVAIKKGIDSLKNLVNEVAVAGDRIDKQSQALGLSRKAYQEWDYILGQNGASIDSLGVSMKTLNSTILSAADGSEEANSALVKLGLNFVELNAQSPEQQFEAVVRAFQKMPAGAKKSALAVKMFGRNGMELLPLLNQADTSIDELRQRAQELGLIMSDDAVDAAVVYGDSLDDLQRTFNAFKYSIGSKILPVLTKGIQGITNYAGKLKKAYDRNGFKGVWDTLVADVRNIKWPTWDDVKKAAQTAWSTIKDGALHIADTMGGLVFGRKEDGSVAWPDITQLAKNFKSWWSETALPALQAGMVWTLTLFGLPTETAEDISNLVSGWWDNMVGAVADACNWVLNLPQMPHDAGKALHEIVRNWWDGVKKGLADVTLWAIGLFTIEDANGDTTVDMIGKWWKNNVAPRLMDVMQFTLGLFGLPSAEQMAVDIYVWWRGVVGRLGQLALNIKSSFDAGIKLIETWFSNTKNSIQIGFKSTIDGWIKTISDWIQNGIDIAVNFFGDLFGVSEKPTKVRQSEGGVQHGGGTVYEGGVQHGGGFAKGLWDVPYDGFIAELHRGERVLTASQAREDRAARNGGVDLSSLAEIVRGAIVEGMNGATVRSYLSGRDVTEDVNRAQIRALKARRFAT